MKVQLRRFRQKFEIDIDENRTVSELKQQFLAIDNGHHTATGIYLTLDDRPLQNAEVISTLGLTDTSVIVISYVGAASTSTYNQGAAAVIDPFHDYSNSDSSSETGFEDCVAAPPEVVSDSPSESPSGSVSGVVPAHLGNGLLSDSDLDGFETAGTDSESCSTVSTNGSGSSSSSSVTEDLRVLRFVNQLQRNPRFAELQEIVRNYPGDAGDLIHQLNESDQRLLQIITLHQQGFVDSMSDLELD